MRVSPGLKRYPALFLLSLILAVSADMNSISASQRDLGWPGETLDGLACQGESTGSGGPFDYNNPEHRAKRLRTVETRHFTPEVEQLISGKSTASLENDIYFMLRYFPNHHRALYAMMRYQLENKNRCTSAIPRMECFLQRAISFFPNDAQVYLVYWAYLHRKGLPEKAIEKYKVAEHKKPSSPDIYSNMSLAYIELKQNSEAVSHAQKAYSLGNPLPTLRNNLKALGAGRRDYPFYIA